MKAIVITQPGGPEVLQLKDYPSPTPGSEEVLIEVKAAGINRADIFQRQGNYPPPPGISADVPGLEVSGIIVQCGEGVNQWKAGDKVCALLAGGGYAEQVVVKEGQCLPVPKGFGFIEAAVLPETIFTVWSNVFQRGNLKAGESLLIHGGASGIGVTAIQLAHAFGAKVFVTVGSEEKGKACIDLGAYKYVNYKSWDFEIALAAEGMDVILDMIGGDYLNKNINILKPEGRIVYINSTGGNLAQLNIHKMMYKRITITGSTLRGREYEYKKALAASVYEHAWPLLEAGKYNPCIYKTFSFTEAADAHKLMESGEHVGKIVLVR